MVRRSPSNLVLVVCAETSTALSVLFICMYLSFEFQFCFRIACDHEPRVLRAHRRRNDALFTGCRPAIGEKYMKWGQRTKFDELVLHEARLAHRQLFHQRTGLSEGGAS